MIESPVKPIEVAERIRDLTCMIADTGQRLAQNPEKTELLVALRTQTSRLTEMQYRLARILTGDMNGS